MAEIVVKDILEAGVHFGHKASRWNPKMRPYIYGRRNKIHIIDLKETVRGLVRAQKYLQKVAAQGSLVLFVGTKRQAQEAVAEAATACGMPYCTERWLGGMLTNWNTIGGRIKELKSLETRMETGELAHKYSKLEVQRYQEQIDQMNTLYGGIKNMPPRPGAVFVFDITHDHNAVKEARKLGLPIIALVDTNADPTPIDHIIPCNDDAIKTIELIMDYAKQAVAAGQAKTKKADKEEEVEGKQ